MYLRRDLHAVERGDLAANAVTLAGVTTGRGAGDSLFVSNASILRSAPALVAAGLNDLDLAFDPAVFAGLTPVAHRRRLHRTGPLATGNLIVAARGGIAAGALDASTGSRSTAAPPSRSAT